MIALYELGRPLPRIFRNQVNTHLTYFFEVNRRMWFQFDKAWRTLLIYITHLHHFPSIRFNSKWTCRGVIVYTYVMYSEMHLFLLWKCYETMNPVLNSEISQKYKYALQCCRKILHYFLFNRKALF